jgi:EmrB/QacA subfamily drug resistance transporter
VTANAHRPHYNLTFATLAIAGVSYSLLQSLVVPALPEIQADLHTTTTGATWIFTAFLLSASIATPIAGRLGDMYGKQHALVIVLALLAAGTFISAIAGSIGVMILGRVVQGAGGAIFPLAFGIIRDEFPPERVRTGIAMISAILGIGGGLGIVLTGPITSHLSYHWLFWFPLIAIVAAGVAAWLVIPESPVRTPGRVDWLGAGLLSGWLVALLLGVSEGDAWGWTSTRVIGLFVAAAVLLVAWVVVETRMAEPLVDMRMMRLPGVWTTNTVGFLIGVGMYGSFVLIPEFVEMPKSTGYGFGASVTEAGLFLIPSTFTMLLFSPLAGRLSGTVGSKVPLLLGTVISTLAFVLLTFAHDQHWQIYLCAALLGAGIGFAFASMANLIVEAVPAEQTGVATGMNTIMRTIGGAIGAQVAASIVASSAAPGGLATDDGYTLAFAVATAALVVSILAAAAVPGGRRRVAAPATAHSALAGTGETN